MQHQIFPCGAVGHRSAAPCCPILPSRTQPNLLLPLHAACRKTPLHVVQARFLLTSTSEVYGDPLQHPQTEEYWGNVNCIGERSCYDEGKRAAECLTFDYYREHNLEVWPPQVLLGTCEDCAWVGTRPVALVKSRQLRSAPAQLPEHPAIPAKQASACAPERPRARLRDLAATAAEAVQICWQRHYEHGADAHTRSSQEGPLPQVRVVRIFNTYGPRMALDDGRVVSNFLAQALTGQPMTIYGDGSQSRSFQYVSDLIKGEAAPLMTRPSN